MKKNLDQSLETKLVEWPLHLNESYVFNTIELFASWGTFEPPNITFICLCRLVHHASVLRSSGELRYKFWG